MAFKAAFFKGQHGFLGGAVIRWWENGPYSHCELVFSDGMWGSSVGTEGGVVMRPRLVIPAEWDYIELPDAMERDARKWFEAHKGKSYDYIGLLRFVFDFLGASKDKWVCSRACADALGMMDGWRLGPNALYAGLSNALVIQ